MIPFKTLENKLIDLKNGGLDSIVKGLVMLSQDYAKDLNRSQLIDGQNIDGSEIEPAYSRITVSYKKAKNQLFDRVTLKDTGAFHKSFTVTAKTDSFVINATDSKKNKLQKKYGEKILGLSEENKNLFARFGLRQQLIKQIKQKI